LIFVRPYETASLAAMQIIATVRWRPVEPDESGDALQIELRGNLATMLGATVQSKRSPESDDLSLQVSLVAGARNQRYLQLWSGAA
jgi:hypothetical protein